MTFEVNFNVYFMSSENINKIHIFRFTSKKKCYIHDKN